MSDPPIDDDRIVISLSKTKLVLLVAGAFLFVVLGLWLLEIADTQRRYPPIYVKGVSIAAVGFFGLCGLYGLRKLFDGSPGLVLDREGIIDNSSGISAGRVFWREIRDIRVVSISGQRLLAFMVDDPEKYLAKGNILTRYLVGWNYRRYGTPLMISSNSLKMRFDDLEKLLQEFRKKHIEP